MSTAEKIRPDQLARPAFVYIRQSTPGEVRHHQESQRRQNDLATHAPSTHPSLIRAIRPASPGRLATSLADHGW